MNKDISKSYILIEYNDKKTNFKFDEDLKEFDDRMEF